MPETESFALRVPGGIVRFDGFIPDRRYSLELRATWPSGRVMRIWVSRRDGGSFVDWEDDEHDCCGGHVDTCVGVVLGYDIADEWPRWVTRFIDELCQKLQIRER